MKKHLSVLLACVFVIMIGLGIAIPVFPFYVERLALAEEAARQSVVMHVGLLTGVYGLGPDGGGRSPRGSTTASSMASCS